MLTWES
jgi:hypothetical protein